MKPIHRPNIYDVYIRCIDSRDDYKLFLKYRLHIRNIRDPKVEHREEGSRLFVPYLDFQKRDKIKYAAKIVRCEKFQNAEDFLEKWVPSLPINLKGLLQSEWVIFA